MTGDQLRYFKNAAETLNKIAKEGAEDNALEVLKTSLLINMTLSLETIADVLEKIAERAESHSFIGGAL